MTLHELVSDARFRIRAVLRGGTMNRELDDEIRFHIERETEKLLRGGMSPDDAARQARGSFGGVARAAEETRRARGISVLETTARDVAYALRALRRTPTFTIATVLVLALGIGASTATYSAVHAVLLAHLPYRDDDQLMRVVQQNSPTNRFTLSTVDYRAIEEQQQSFSAVGAMTIRTLPVSAGNAEPAAARVVLITADLLRALDVTVPVGRPLSVSDEAIGATPVMLVSHAYALRTFGGDSAALGRTILVDGAARPIIGVLPPGVRALGYWTTDLWSVLQLRTPQRRGPFGLHVVGRLRDGVSPEMAARDLTGISRRIFPLWQAGFQDSLATLTPVPLREWIIGNSNRTMWMVAAAVLLVLLTAIVNVANLVLVRATARGREVALRSALGATRGRLMRLVVTESFVLALVGAVAGLAVAWGMLHVFVAIGSNIPRISQAALNLQALAFAVGLAALTGVAIGLYPVVALFGGDLAPALHGGTRATGARRTTALRGMLVAVEFALALPLLAGAGVFARSVVRLNSVDPGFDAERVAYVQIGLPAARYDSAARVASYWTDAIDRMGALPGVRAAGYATELPPVDVGNANNFYFADEPLADPNGAQPTSPWLIASPRYFDAMGMRLLAGRTFTDRDTVTNDPVLIVSASWVRHYSPNRDAVGRQLVEGGCVACPHPTIVGVVSDVKYDGLTGTGDGVYVPPGTGWSRGGYLFVGTTGPASAMLASVRAALRSLDATVPLEVSGTLVDQMDQAMAAPRHWTSLLAGFAAVALALAAIGVFGVLSYMVSSRRREIGVRLALGAPHGAITRMVVQRGMGYGIAGAAVGLAVAFAGQGMLSGQLFQVSATDPFTLGAVTLLLLAVAWVACWMAARRAAVIEPMEVMRAE